MPLYSEYTTTPRLIAVYHPKQNLGLRHFSANDQATHNFAAVPNWSALLEEFESLLKAIESSGIPTVDISDYAPAETLTGLHRNPNSLFVRDSLITLPWQGHTVIVPNMRLPARRGEPAIMKSVAAALGIHHFIELPPDHYLEGGDVLAISHEGLRTLLVGIGPRTNVETPVWLAQKLIPDDIVDQVIGLRHQPALLHLDTGLAVLPNQVILMANQSLLDGLVIGQDLKPHPIEPIDYLLAHGYHLLSIDTRSAAEEEDCNLLYVGHDRFLSFRLPPDLASRLEATAGIQLQQLIGSEICKANGGVHCLTRPFY